MKYTTKKLVQAALLLALVAAPAALAGSSDGTVVGATKILDHGSDAERFDLVVVAEGYEDFDLPIFGSQAQSLLDHLLATPPFPALEAALNVWRIDVASTQTGADDPLACAGSAILPFTYFDATYCTGGQYRRLLTVNHALLFQTVEAFVPAWDQIVVLVNSPVQGGLTGTVSVIAPVGEWQRTVLHQLGHAAFGLEDEYDYFDGCDVDAGREVHPAVEPVGANVTIATALDGVEWADLIEAGTPLPTTTNPDAACAVCDTQPDPFPGSTVVGLYEGAHHFHCGAYRPAFHCMMRDLGPFCPVCARRIEEILGPFLAQDPGDPNDPPVCDAGGPYVAECAGATTAVALDGSGSQDPDGDALSYSWTGGFAGGTATGPLPTVELPGTGTFPVTLAVSDAQLEASCAAEVAVVDTRPPTLVAPNDVRVDCAPAAGVAVELGAPLVSDVCDAAVAVGHDGPELFPLGDTVVTWTAEDAAGLRATDTQLVSVGGGGEPARITVSVSPAELWPPNRQLVPVTVSVRVEGGCGETPVVRLVSISSNDVAERAGVQVEEPDWSGADLGTDDREFLLRAERRGGGFGRIYSIVYEVVDGAGNRAEATAYVHVPMGRSARTESGPQRTGAPQSALRSR